MRGSRSVETSEKAGEQRHMSLLSPHAFFAPVCFLDPPFRLSWSLEQAKSSLLESKFDKTHTHWKIMNYTNRGWYTCDSILMSVIPRYLFQVLSIPHKVLQARSIRGCLQFLEAPRMPGSCNDMLWFGLKF